MRTVTRLSGVKINNPLLEKIVVSQDELDLANIPKIIMWLQAGGDFFDEDTKDIRDRVSGDLLVSSDTSKAPALSSFSNGADAFDFPSEGVSPYSVPTEINASAWSVVFSGRPSSVNPPGELLYPLTQISDSSHGLRVGFNTTGNFRVWRGDSTVRISSGVDIVDVDTVLIATFSVENGLTLIKDGTVIVTAPDDKTPLDQTTFKFGSNDSNMFEGLLGHLMVFDIDLADSKYSAQLAAVNRIMKAKYGIA